MISATGIVVAMVKTPHGTLGQRLHDDQREHGEQNHHDGEHADERERADRAADFLLHHLTERLPTPPHRSEEHDHVVHTAAQRRADQESTSVPGRKPNCAASTGPTSGPGPAIAAK